MDQGVFICGYFICFRGARSRRDEGKIDYSVTLATGRDTFTVWMDDADEDDLESIKVGTEIMVQARPYVGKNGKLAWTGGKLA